MNGAADLGGMMGFGKVLPEADEPWFHAEWERRALGLTLAAGACGLWNLDVSRHARESLPPAEYLSASYYEIWIKALETLAISCGMISAAELANDGAHPEPPVPAKVLRAGQVDALLAAGTPYDRPVTAQPKFAAGDRVATKVMHPQGHTRLPRYAIGKRGVIEAARGVFVFPDTNGHRQGEQPQWCYTVRFEGQELWGNTVERGVRVSIDAFEDYLDPA